MSLKKKLFSFAALFLLAMNGGINAADAGGDSGGDSDDDDGDNFAQTSLDVLVTALNKIKTSPYNQNTAAAKQAFIEFAKTEYLTKAVKAFQNTNGNLDAKRIAFEEALLQVKLYATINGDVDTAVKVANIASLEAARTINFSCSALEAISDIVAIAKNSNTDDADRANAANSAIANAVETGVLAARALAAKSVAGGDKRDLADITANAATLISLNASDDVSDKERGKIAGNAFYLAVARKACPDLITAVLDVIKVKGEIDEANKATGDKRNDKKVNDLQEELKKRKDFITDAAKGTVIQSMRVDEIADALSLAPVAPKTFGQLTGEFIKGYRYQHDSRNGLYAARVARGGVAVTAILIAVTSGIGTVIVKVKRKYAAWKKGKANKGKKFGAFVKALFKGRVRSSLSK